MLTFSKGDFFHVQIVRWESIYNQQSSALWIPHEIDLDYCFSPPPLQFPPFRFCNENSPCPLPIFWSSWGPWTKCSANCGGGVHSRLRSCENGNTCPGCPVVCVCWFVCLPSSGCCGQRAGKGGRKSLKDNRKFSVDSGNWIAGACCKHQPTAVGFPAQKFCIASMHALYLN